MTIRRGQRFKTLRRVAAGGITEFRAPGSGGFECSLDPGVVVTVLSSPLLGASAVAALCDDYSRIERSVVPEEDRASRNYRGFHLVVPLSALDSDCQQVLVNYPDHRHAAAAAGSETGRASPGRSVPVPLITRGQWFLVASDMPVVCAAALERARRTYKRTLPASEAFVVVEAPEGRASVAGCLPECCEALEESLVPDETRSRPDYSGYDLSVDLDWIARACEKLER
ncbi:MAG: hypothetical protein L0216_20930 [Planctomycetales bacterium]|nr:hypothetical protein [Planctomycetales bacterium]